jgi:hypothetical protein
VSTAASTTEASQQLFDQLGLQHRVALDHVHCAPVAGRPVTP